MNRLIARKATPVNTDNATPVFISHMSYAHIGSECQKVKSMNIMGYGFGGDGGGGGGGWGMVAIMDQMLFGCTS